MIDEELAKVCLKALRPAPRMLPSEFAEQQIILPASSNAIAGPLALTNYQRGMIDSVVEEDAEVIVLLLSSQSGKSLSIDCIMSYFICQEPGPMLCVQPTSGRAEEYSRDRLSPLIDSSPALKAIVGTGRSTKKGSSGGSDALMVKTFPGGQLNLASSHQPDTLAARAIRVLLLDEIERYAISAGREGDPVTLALKRTTSFVNRGRRVVISSTPTTKTGSRIDSWFKRGDQRRWHVTCEECQHEAPFQFENIKWEEAKPATAYLSCEECGCIIDEPTRRRMIENGRWVATAEGEKGIISFHLDEVSSLFSSMERVAVQWDEAKTPEQRQSFMNVVLARVFDASMEVELSATELQARSEPIAAPFDKGIAFITVGADVQSDRIEATVLAHHFDDTYSVLDHIRIPGDTSGSAPWQQLDAAMGTVYPLADGRKLTVQAIAVDGGFNALKVIEFVNAQRRQQRAAFVIKGVSGFDRLPLARGGKIKGVMGLMLVGVDSVKLTVQRRLAMTEFGPGWIRLPSFLGAEYYEGLASEELRVRYVRGAPRHEYHKVRRANEAFDSLIYSMAIGAMAKPQQAPAAKPGPSIKELAARLNAAHNS